MKSIAQTSSPWGIASVLVFVLTQIIGLSVHHGGYGTGPEGVGAMLMGVLIGLTGWVIAPILGIVSLTKREASKIYAIVSLTGPIVMLILIVAEVIRI